jgi:hypothetical protein
VTINLYLGPKEWSFVKKQEPGYLRELVQREMANAPREIDWSNWEEN